jgi:hypothetical protein
MKYVNIRGTVTSRVSCIPIPTHNNRAVKVRDQGIVQVVEEGLIIVVRTVNTSKKNGIPSNVIFKPRIFWFESL